MLSFARRRRDKRDTTDGNLTKRLLERLGSSSTPPFLESTSPSSGPVTLHSQDSRLENVPDEGHDLCDNSQPTANGQSPHRSNQYHGLPYASHHHNPVPFSHGSGGGGIESSAFYDINQTAYMGATSQSGFENTGAPVLNVGHPRPSQIDDAVLTSSYINHQDSHFPVPPYAQNVAGHTTFAVPLSESSPSNPHVSPCFLGSAANTFDAHASLGPASEERLASQQVCATRFWIWSPEIKCNKFRIQVRCANLKILDLMAEVDTRLTRSQISTKAAEFMQCVRRPLPKKRRRNEEDKFAYIPVVGTEFGPIEVGLNIVVKDVLEGDFIQLRLALPGLKKLGLLKDKESPSNNGHSPSANALIQNRWSVHSPAPPERGSPDPPRCRPRLYATQPHNGSSLPVRSSGLYSQSGPESPRSNGARQPPDNHEIEAHFGPAINDLPVQGPLPWSMQHHDLPPDASMRHHLSPASTSQANDEAPQANQLYNPHGPYHQFRQ